MQNETAPADAQAPPETPVSDTEVPLSQEPGLKTTYELTEEVMAEVADTDAPAPEPGPEPESEPVTPASKNSSMITIASGSGRVRMPMAAYQAMQEAKNGPT